MNTKQILKSMTGGAVVAGIANAAIGPASAVTGHGLVTLLCSTTIELEQLALSALIGYSSAGLISGGLTGALVTCLGDRSFFSSGKVMYRLLYTCAQIMGVMFSLSAFMAIDDQEYNQASSVWGQLALGSGLVGLLLCAVDACIQMDCNDDSTQRNQELASDDEGEHASDQEDLWSDPSEHVVVSAYGNDDETDNEQDRLLLNPSVIV
jgi:hypothetical protein